ncbi:MAG: ribosome-associated translation inhibitor RaiA [Bacteroidia bacterium]|nr:ribosome-associated translation inhibitor RaiA [Bacteroidia bacterium]
MKLQIQSIHFDADKKLLDFIQKKVSKLETFYDRILDGNVFLKIDKDSSHEDKIAEIKLQIPGGTMIAKEKCKTFEEAIDLNVESLRRQIKKHKGKQMNKRHQHEPELQMEEEY